MTSFFESLIRMIPTADELLNLEPRELAGHFLLLIENPERIVPDSVVTADALSYAVGRTKNEDYPSATGNAVLFALMEAWQCLVNDGLVAPIPTQQFGSRGMYHSTHYFVTRLGQSIKDYEDFKVRLL